MLLRVCFYKLENEIKLNVTRDIGKALMLFLLMFQYILHSNFSCGTRESDLTATFVLQRIKITYFY